MPHGIQAAERATYEDVWSSVSHYTTDSPGEMNMPLFLQMASPGGSVLDAGTGSGKGALALAKAGYNVTCCDLTADGLVPEARALPFKQLCLWEPLRTNWLRRFDYVYCCDVLEHIPPQFTMLAVARMLEVCKRGLFTSVTLIPDNLGIWVGKALHQTVQPFEWWRDSFGEIGDVVDARDLLISGVYFVKPRV